MIVRRISPLPFAKVSGIIYVILGRIAGVMFALFSHGAGARRSGGAVFDAVFGVGALVFMPIGYGVLGFLVSLFWLPSITSLRNSQGVSGYRRTEIGEPEIRRGGV